jgi:glycosyltransferase involved in cell wall biosynthesis
MAPVCTAFVMEQSLGHVTHYRNLRDVADQQLDIEPVWLPIPFAVSGAERFLPLLRSNWSVRASWRARRALDAVRTPVDAVVFHTQVTALFSKKMMRRVPSVISLDATPINFDTLGKFYRHRAAGNGVLDRRKYELNRSAFHAASALVTWSEWARQSLIDDYGVDSRRVHVLAPGASPAYFEIGRRRATRSATAVERVRLLFVGGDFERKGGPELLALMRGPLGEVCDLHIVTHADIPAQQNVLVYRGLEANSPELLRLFEDADAFVLPSHGECLAVVLMEATAAGLPVITTRVGALGEAVAHQESGLLIEAGDAGALHKALHSLLTDPPRRQRMGRAGHALARDKFDAQRNNRVLLDLIRELSAARTVSRRAA